MPFKSKELSDTPHESQSKIESLFKPNSHIIPKRS